MAAARDTHISWMVCPRVGRKHTCDAADAADDLQSSLHVAPENKPKLSSLLLLTVIFYASNKASCNQYTVELPFRMIVYGFLFFFFIIITTSQLLKKIQNVNYNRKQQLQTELFDQLSVVNFDQI